MILCGDYFLYQVVKVVSFGTNEKIMHPFSVSAFSRYGTAMGEVDVHDRSNSYTPQYSTPITMFQPFRSPSLPSTYSAGASTI